MQQFLEHLRSLWLIALPSLSIIATAGTVEAQILDKREILQQQKYLDNQDFDWYVKQIPFFECPDPDITTTYYYRWELITKHLTYGSPNTGYVFTEFIDRPFWSGAYGAISCPAGHQLYESRWLRSPRIAKDYARYWFETPGAQPRNYSTWLADSVFAIHLIHPDESFIRGLLNELIGNYKGWEQRHYDKEIGLFWQTGHDDGMEFNINSRQTQDILRGAPSYRPSFNAYMWADAKAIAKIARLDGNEPLAQEYEAKADSLKRKIIDLLWDERRGFFFPVLRNAEERDGFRMEALTKTYESGQFAGDSHGRELIGYVPWQFNMFAGDDQFDESWKKLMDRDGFYADYGPSTVERNDPMFLLQKSCCWWSGQSWPYATTQTLKGLANLLQSGSQALSSDDYVDLLSIYAKSHRKDGRPYLAEALHPDSGSFEGHDGYNHSEHYFHSGYCDLVLTGLVGLVPRADDNLIVHPLAPETWSYFAAEDIPYRGHHVSVVWDKSGSRYGFGKGLHVLVDGNRVGGVDTLTKLTLKDVVPLIESESSTNEVPTNFAVNNDGTYYPRVTATYTAQGTSVAKVNDGNYWYLQHPPNRWTSENSPNAAETILIDFGTERTIDTVQLYLLDDAQSDASSIRLPQAIQCEYLKDDRWMPIENAISLQIVGHKPLAIKMPGVATSQIRITLQPQDGFHVGLTEIETWGNTTLPISPASPPAGNLAYNRGDTEYPRATASFTDPFGGRAMAAIDGITNFLPTPMNRWTSYESKSATDWLEIDFGKTIEFQRVELAVYDDRGGVQPPQSILLQYWADGQWADVPSVVIDGDSLIGSQWNVARFPAVSSSKCRITFTHQSPARSGVTEVTVWND